MQKSFFDWMWALSFARKVEMLGHDEEPADLSQFMANLIREGGISQSAEIRSFADAYKMASFDTPWTIEDVAVWDEVEQIAAATNTPVPPMSITEREEMLARVRHAVGFAIWKQGPKAIGLMRSMLIYANLHASVRVDLKNDPTMKFVGNDIYDFDHAAAAVGYCDYFFTERSLTRRLTRSEIALDKVYACTVANQPEEALEFARAI